MAHVHTSLKDISQDDVYFFSRLHYSTDTAAPCGCGNWSSMATQSLANMSFPARVGCSAPSPCTGRALGPVPLEQWGLRHLHHQCAYPHLHPGKLSLPLPALQLLPGISGSPFHSPCNLVSELDCTVLTACLLLTPACCPFPHISEKFCRIRTAC